MAITFRHHIQKRGGGLSYLGTPQDITYKKTTFSIWENWTTTTKKKKRHFCYWGGLLLLLLYSIRNWNKSRVSSTQTARLGWLREPWQIRRQWRLGRIQLVKKGRGKKTFNIPKCCSLGLHNKSNYNNMTPFCVPPEYWHGHGQDWIIRKKESGASWRLQTIFSSLGKKEKNKSSCMRKE